MAIHIENPVQITDQMLRMHNLISTTGKEFLTEYARIVECLARDWTGSDAVANQKDLANVYSEVTKLMKTLERLIEATNNNEVYPLLRHIELSGGSSYKKENISASLGSVKDSVQITSEGTVSKTNPEIIQDAADFNGLPEKFEMLKEDLLMAKEDLFKNWLDGANIADVKSSFGAFASNVDSYISQLKKVRDNLNTVAENKKQLL